MIRTSRGTTLLKFWSIVTLTKVTNLDPSRSRGPWQSGLIEAGIKMFEEIDWNEEGAATTEEGNTETLLDMRRHWRTKRNVCLARVQRLISSRPPHWLVHRQLYCWPLEIMKQKNCLQLKWKYPTETVIYHFMFFFVNTLFSSSKRIFWNYPSYFNIPMTGKSLSIDV